MPRSPKNPTIFFTTWSKPGTERRVCSAARSAGCSHATGAICVRILRGRAAGRVDSVITGSYVKIEFQLRLRGPGVSRVNSSSRALERLLQVPDQVLHILDPHGQPDQA